MSNVFYQGQIIYEEHPEAIVIDSNDFANELVEAEEKAERARIAALERAKRLAQMEEEGIEVPEGVEPEEFSALADTLMEEAEEYTQTAEEIIASANEEAEAILNNARLEADSILNKAELDADTMKTLARQDGEKEGYNDGLQQAASEMAAKQAELDDYVQNMQEMFSQKEMTLSRDVVNLCCDVFERVFSAELSGRKDVLFHLIDNCLMNIEPSHQMQIKVNDDNVAFLREKKPEILERVGSEVTLDIIADPLLSESGCIIETDGGLFDCGIDTELSELIRNIKALA